jgi:hypothetical protein
MSVFDFARVVIYRFHEKGLEVFLVNSDTKNDPDVWKIPKTEMHKLKQCQDCIELDTVTDKEGQEHVTLAVEGDWHDIPSIRGLIKHDIKLAKETIKEVVPGIEKGGFFAIKEAIKHTMPDEYQALKELKDILFDRNTVKNM